MKLKKLLVPVDFSDASLEALRVAGELAKEFEATLHVFHSFPVIPPIVAPYAPAVPLDYLDQVSSSATEHLHQWRQKYCDADADIVEHVDSASPSESIVELAAELEVDMIVMGTRGITGLKHVLLGSVAERVVRTAACPVLTVKEG
jgi:universal stress protein A